MTGTNVSFKIEEQQYGNINFTIKLNTDCTETINLTSKLDYLKEFSNAIIGVDTNFILYAFGWGDGYCSLRLQSTGKIILSCDLEKSFKTTFSFDKKLLTDFAYVIIGMDD